MQPQPTTLLAFQQPPRRPLWKTKTFAVCATIGALVLLYISIPGGGAASWGLPSVGELGGKLAGALNGGGGGDSAKDEPPPSPLASLEAFTAEALAHDISPAPYDGRPLRELCDKTQWKTGVFMTCALAGGIGNVRLGFLSCARVAIETGAKLLLPRVFPRIAFGEMTQSFNFSYDASLHTNYLIDVAHFVEAFQHDCPQMVIVDADDKPAMARWKLDPQNFTQLDGRASVPTTTSTKMMADGADWRPFIDGLLRDQFLTPLGVAALSDDDPVLLNLWDCAFFWPVQHDGPDFYAHYGKLARYPPKILALTAKLLHRIYATLGIRESPARIAAHGFLGFHLRTAPDAAAAGWESYEVQRDTMKTMLVENSLSDVFVATGSAPHVAQLKEDVKDTEVTVGGHSKMKVKIWQKDDFFDADDKKFVDSLTWDQVSIIDQDIMLRASHFVGLGHSSWSWQVALKRHAWSKEENPLDYEKNMAAFKDEFSLLAGPPFDVMAPTLWI